MKARQARCLKIIEALFKAVYTCYIYNTVFGRLRSKCINQSFLSSTSCTIECERVHARERRATSETRDFRVSKKKQRLLVVYSCTKAFLRFNGVTTYFFLIVIVLIGQLEPHF